MVKGTSSSAGLPDEDFSRYLPLVHTQNVDHILYTETESGYRDHERREKKRNTTAPMMTPKTKIDFAATYAETKSYVKTRKCIQRQISDELTCRRKEREVEERAHFRKQFERTFIEEQVATSGRPTINTLSKLIERRKFPRENQKPEFSASERVVRTKLQRALSRGTMDLKSLGLVKVPEQLYASLVLQLIHYMPELVLNDNQIRYLDAVFFEKFAQLTSLQVRDNQLTHFPAEIVNMTRLKKLNCDMNQLFGFPANLPPNLRTLSAKYNHIESLPQLHMAVNLTELNLSENKLRLVPFAFCHLVQLKQIKMAKNKLCTGAILPRPMEPKKQPGTSHGEHWIEQFDEDRQVSVYFNTVTRELSRIQPPGYSNSTRSSSIIIQGNANAMMENSSTGVLDIDTQDTSNIVPRLNFNQLSSTTSKAKPPTSAPPGAKEEKQEDPDVDLDWQKYPGGWEVLVNPPVITFYNHQRKTSTTRIPTELDRWDYFSSLHTLNLCNNQLTELPQSVGKLLSLKTLEVEWNQLTHLPRALPTSLLTLKAGNNRLTKLPLAILKCRYLRELDVQMNRITNIPYDIGSCLTHLRLLNLSCNALTIFPPTVLQCNFLKDLRLHGNPDLDMPSQASILKGVEAIFWECRNQIQVDTRGLPPALERIPVGIADECHTSNIHIRKAFLKQIDLARHSHELDFHWKNLTINDLPPPLFELSETLVALRLIGHAFTEMPPDIAKFQQIKVLSLRINAMTSIPESCFTTTNFAAQALVELNVDENQLTALPESIQYCTQLRLLRCSKNNIQTLIPEIGCLVRLQELYLNHNHLTILPSSLSRCLSLERLDLSHNRLSSLEPVDFTTLTRLAHLRVNLNQLVDLPDSIGSLPLEELALSGNHFRMVPPILMALQATLTGLYMQMNHLSELPSDFGTLRELKRIELDGNPLRSPPLHVILEGVHVIRVYLHTRETRREEICALFTHAGCTVDAAHLIPHTKDFIQGGGDHLTPKDLTDIERRVDRYVNGAFYALPPSETGLVIIQDVIALRYERGQVQRRKILDDFLKFLELIVDKRWLDGQDFQYHELFRPMGEAGMDVRVYLINPEAIYTRSVAPDIPSIVELVAKRVEHGFTQEAFGWAEAEVRDAVAHYVGPYGPVGFVTTESELPFICGCHDVIRMGKQHSPCYRPGWMVQQTIFTEEEAKRKAEEEEMSTKALDRIRMELVSYFDTEAGLDRFEDEAEMLRGELRREIKVLKKQTIRNSDRLVHGLEKEQKNVEKEFQKAKLKAGDSWTVGDEKFYQEELADVRSSLETQKLKLEQAWTSLRTKLAQIQSPLESFKPQVIQGLLELTGKDTLAKVVENQRYLAMQQRWRRPWDEPDFGTYVRQKMNSNLENQVGGPPPVKGNSEISDVSFDDPDKSSVSSGDSNASSLQRLEARQAKIQLAMEEEEDEESLEEEDDDDSDSDNE